MRLISVTAVNLSTELHSRWQVIRTWTILLTKGAWTDRADHPSLEERIATCLVSYSFQNFNICNRARSLNQLVLPFLLPVPVLPIQTWIFKRFCGRAAHQYINIKSGSLSSGLPANYSYSSGSNSDLISNPARIAFISIYLSIKTWIMTKTLWEKNNIYKIRYVKLVLKYISFTDLPIDQQYKNNIENNIHRVSIEIYW